MKRLGVSNGSRKETKGPGGGRGQARIGGNSIRKSIARTGGRKSIGEERNHAIGGETNIELMIDS